jgi:hypothetical protein
MSYDAWLSSAPDPGTVADREDADACVYCEAMPDQPHHPTCPCYQPTFDALAYCDQCATEYLTVCACDGHDCDE